MRKYSKTEKVEVYNMEFSGDGILYQRYNVQYYKIHNDNAHLLLEFLNEDGSREYFKNWDKLKIEVAK